jgi:hypothetical protein
MAAALACGLTAGRERERRGAVDALLHLVGNGGLDAGLLGREVRLLLTTDDAAAGHVAEALACVGRGGAWHVVWAVAYGVVPGLLRVEPVPAGLPALLAVAAEAAVAVGARADLPELTAAAARADGSPLNIEAARLARAIA